jgi:putative aldouronate transport system permease protein
MKIKTGADTVLMNLLGVFVLGSLALFCILPFLLIISGSLSDDSAVVAHGYTLMPQGFTLDAYRAIFAMPKLVGNAYAVTAFITLAGTVVALFVVTTAAYVISRKDFPFRDAIAFYFYFTTLFSGGLVAYYIIMIRYYHMKDSLLALIIPALVNPFYILMMRNFITQSIHEALVESARIDGAGDFRIYIRIVMPLLTPAIATIGLFIALGYWNDWYNAMLFLSTESKFPLQYMLYRILTQAQNMNLVMKASNVKINVPKETIKLSLTIVTIGPIVLAYPFVQKYFVTGLTIGAVKG